MCIRDRPDADLEKLVFPAASSVAPKEYLVIAKGDLPGQHPVSYTHLRAHETVLDLVCRLLLENKRYR